MTGAYSGVSVPVYDFTGVPSELEIPLIVAPYRFVDPGFHLHAHTYGELVCVVDGRGMHQREAITCEIRRGDVLYIPPGVVHGFYDSRGMDIRNVAFNENSLSDEVWRSLRGLSGYHTLFHLEPALRCGCSEDGRLTLMERELPAVVALLDRMQREYREMMIAHGAMLTALLIEYLTLLCRLFSRREYARLAPIARAAALMENTYNAPLRLRDLAGESNLSVNQFLRLFRASYGVSPMRRLGEIRLDHAARLLRETDETIINVGMQCGFADSNYFARTFRRRYGVSPRAYRRK